MDRLPCRSTVPLALTRARPGPAPHAARGRLGSAMSRACRRRSNPSWRGTTWKWMWNTLWPAAAPFSCAIRIPGASNAFLHRARDALRGEDGGRERLGRQVEQVFGRRLRDDQHVAVGLRHDVHERERVLVLVHLVGRDLAAQDAREDVVAVVGHGRPSEHPRSREYSDRPAAGLTHIRPKDESRPTGRTPSPRARPAPARRRRARRPGDSG